jgi:glycosyltransferase involved in cell wall biosynthesis
MHPEMQHSIATQLCDAPAGRVSRPLRILVAHNVPASRKGGMSRIMGFIHDHLVLAGHSVDYFCSEDVPGRFQGRLSRFAFPALVRSHAVNAARLGRPYDIVNVHEPSGAAIALWKRAAGCPRVVVTSHGLEHRGWELQLEEGRLGRGGPMGRSRLIYPATVLWQAGVTLRHADHVFCLNMEDREYLVSRFGMAASKITRIFPAADPIYGESASRRDYARAETLLFGGTWLQRKGTGDLVEAFSILAARHPQLKLTVLNGGVPESAIRASFPEPVRARVTCLRAEPEEGTAAALAASDIYLLPSLFEGTPLTLMESMWSGMPIVTTATCGMRDIIQDGKNGLLVPIRAPHAIVSAVERLLDEHTLRAGLGRAAHLQARDHYTWRHVAQPVLEVYETLSTVGFDAGTN